MRPESEVAEIVSSTHEGKGIASTDGKKVFVKGAIIGEKYIVFEIRESLLCRRKNWIHF